MLEMAFGLEGNDLWHSAALMGMPVEIDLGLTLSPRSRIEETDAFGATPPDTLLALCEDESVSNDSLDALFNEPCIGAGIVSSSSHADGGSIEEQWLADRALCQAIADINAFTNPLQRDATAPLQAAAHENGCIPQDLEPRELIDTTRAVQPHMIGNDDKTTCKPLQTPPSVTTLGPRIAQNIVPCVVIIEAENEKSAQEEAGEEHQVSLNTSPAESLQLQLTHPPQTVIHQPPNLCNGIDARSETLSIPSVSREASRARLKRSWTRHFPSTKLSTARHSNHLNFDPVATSKCGTSFALCASSQPHTSQQLQSVPSTDNQKASQSKMSVRPYYLTLAGTGASDGSQVFASTPLTPKFPDAGPSDNETAFSLNRAYGFNAFDSFPDNGLESFDVDDLDMSAIDSALADQPKTEAMNDLNQSETLYEATVQPLPLDTMDGVVPSQEHPTFCETSMVPLDQFLDMKQRLLDLQGELMSAKTEIRTLQSAVKARSPMQNNVDVPSAAADTTDESCRSSPSMTPGRLTKTQKRLNKRLSNDNWRRRKAEKASLLAQYGPDSAEFKAAVCRLQTRTGRVSKAGGRATKTRDNDFEHSKMVPERTSDSEKYVFDRAAGSIVECRET